MTINLQTNPGSIAVATTDYPTIEGVMGALLFSGESISSATVRLQTSDRTRQIQLPDAATVVGSNIYQKVLGSLLTPGTLYRMIWEMTLSTGDLISQQTALSCPY